MTRVLLVGLDCLGADVLRSPHRTLMPNLERLAASGLHGVLTSTLPPITVPAWTSMLSGRDPGELGVYGFRNRRSFGYDDLVFATSAAVRAPRIWDRLTDAGRPSIVVGVPQTSPPPAILGALVSGFEGPLNAAGVYTHPPHLATEVAGVVGEYLFDVPEFRQASLDSVRETAYLMTERRFALMRHLLRTRSWDFAMVHEIGPDRIHHCFWSYHDPSHPRHEPASPYRHVVADYYRFLDHHLGELLADVGDDTAIVVASDHGAKAMQGGVCVNEILREAGLLVLRNEPDTPTALTPDMVDWPLTTAWAEGGYYSRVFLNIAGREPQGLVRPGDRGAVIARLKQLFGTIELSDGRMLRNTVEEPANLYRRVRGLPPDLMVFFDGESWRGIGSVGFGSPWVSANDTGVDEANHARDGMYVLRVSPAAPGRRQDASILDIAPTVLNLLGLSVDSDLPGRDLLAGHDRWDETEALITRGARP
jgi:predicted AlkP superfamily phosphohydrolase/phosphomutase